MSISTFNFKKMVSTVIFSMLVAVVVLLSVSLIIGKNKNRWHHFYEDDHSITEIVDHMNGKDTISVTFQYDILVFIPVNGSGYVAYSEISENDHCIDYLWLDEAKEFLYYSYINPIDNNYKGEAIEANEYYRMILDKYVHWEFFNPKDTL